jgi:hypothetical protein
MTQNLHLLLQNFFTKNPDIRSARSKKVVNRRALAKYIINEEGLNVNRYEALVTALRRFEVEPIEKESLKAIEEINISTKDKIAIIYLEKTEEVLKNIVKITSLVNFNKNETLKFVQGSLSFKVFVDEYNVDAVKSIVPKRSILKIHHNISELNLVFPKYTPKVRGIISYVTSELTINKINITEIITGDPELIIYVQSKDLLKAYETIKWLGE